MRRLCRLPFALAAALAAPLTLPAAGHATTPATVAAVQRGLDRLDAARGGPPDDGREHGQPGSTARSSALR